MVNPFEDSVEGSLEGSHWCRAHVWNNVPGHPRVAPLYGALLGYASARRVLGRGQRVLTQRHALHRPDAHRLADRDLVDLPVHASWLNQVENYFSILQRKAITGRDFTDLDQFAQRVLAFQDRDNTTAEPFDWKYTRHDLGDNLQRLSEHKHDLAT
ncbi:hypothetical protein ACFVVC_04435 [Pseudarthrobacter sp. NPDC058196]|uniref:hypothetical protein n=1 Tax=Pseudarthrobacter sp. NPDC058196 TaxID=3346376 RepID=UPI0036DECA48